MHRGRGKWSRTKPPPPFQTYLGIALSFLFSLFWMFDRMVAQPDTIFTTFGVKSGMHWACVDIARLDCKQLQRDTAILAVVVSTSLGAVFDTPMRPGGVRGLNYRLPSA